jgi:predicted acylesterase/phospholipase RssA
MEPSLPTGAADAPPVPHEIRLALVMNGGVSLAVWMGGVTHELDLLRRSSNAPAVAETENGDETVRAIWGEVLTAAGARVVIDVVSGTSAGGLNGTLLATAIARGSTLPPLRNVWQESAALDRLLQDPTGTSILNGTVFSDSVQGVIEEIGLSEPARRGPVDLFVTATALGGRDLPYTDSFGNRFEVADHRRLYRFRYGTQYRYARENGAWDFRVETVDHFAAGSTKLLVCAARASAGYPGAFPPVSEMPLVERRQRPQRMYGFPASWVMDGGVLNNAPFEPVLEAIADRGEATSPVKRVLVYVVPSVGLHRVAGDAEPVDGVPVYKPAMTALQYPTEANLRSGTEEMAARLRGRTHNMPSDLLDRASRDPALKDQLITSARQLLGEYRRNRTYALITESREQLAPAGTETSFAVSRDSGPEGTDLLLAEGDDRYLWVPRLDGEEILGPWPEWRWGLPCSERVLQCMSLHLRNTITRTGSPGQTALTGPQNALFRADVVITDLLHRIAAATAETEEQLRAHFGMTNDDSDPAVAGIINQVYEDLGLTGRLSAIIAEASAVYADAFTEAGIANGLGDEQAVETCLAIEVITHVYATPATLLQPLPPEFKFLRLGPDNMGPLFHEDHLAGLGDRKLYGLRLMHFGAFVHETWRHSDFTWGRLDAAHHLLSLFDQLTPEQREEYERRLHLAILRAEAPHDAGADSTPEEVAEEPEPAMRWMREHLREARVPDRELLNRFADTEAGKATMRRVVASGLRLVGSTRAPETASGGKRGRRHPVRTLWRRVAGAARTVFATAVPPEPRPSLRARCVRLVTVHIRATTHEAIREDPRTLPRAVRAATRRTALGAVGCLLLVMLATAAVTWAITWAVTR